MSDSEQYFGGVDFSGARGALSNLWSAIGHEADGRLHILSLRPHAFRADLADYLRSGWRSEVDAPADAPLLCGLDFPLGVPAAALQTVFPSRPDWATANAWLAERSPDEVADACPDHRKTPRRCDAGTAMAPLDLRLYKQTVAGARWLHEMRAAGAVDIRPHAPRPDAPLTLIEVYPSVTAKDIGIKAKRKPKAPGEAATRPAALREYLTFAHPALEAAAVTLEDAWDATLAALTAWLVRDDLDQPSRIAPDDAELIALEGWIYRHPLALSDSS